MIPAVHAEPAQTLTLRARTAADLMVANPVSIRDNATIREAVALLTDKGFSAAPVIDNAGHPVGVVSRADIITHDREKLDHLGPQAEYYDDTAVHEDPRALRGSGSQVVDVDRTRVRDIMTPVVFSVAPDAPAAKAVEEMVALKVHRIFVVDKTGVLVGVISAVDVLRHLE